MSGSQSGVVTFSYATWVARYPEFAASVTAGQAQGYFDEACIYLDNTACARVPIPPRATILNMLTAHIAQLYAILNGQPSPQTVGRISNATQGSVSVGLDMGTTTTAQAWFLQTKYGASAWQALAAYRTARFYAAPRRYLGVGGYGGVG